MANIIPSEENTILQAFQELLITKPALLAGKDFNKLQTDLELLQGQTIEFAQAILDWCQKDQENFKILQELIKLRIDMIQPNQPLISSPTPTDPIIQNIIILVTKEIKPPAPESSANNLPNE